MTLLEIKLKSGGFRQLDRRNKEVRKLIKDLSDRKAVLNKMKQRQIKRWSQNYRSEGAEYGDKWAEKSKTSLRYRPFGDVLNNTGSTMQTFNKQNAQGRISATNVSWSFHNLYGEGTGIDAAPHGQIVSFHEGYVFHSGNVPARLLWDLDKKDDRENEKILDDWMRKLIANFGD